MQVNLFPLPSNDAFTDLFRGFALFMHRVAVIELFQACPALGGMGAFVTAVQALVAQTVAIALTGLLVDDVRDLGCQFVGMGLKWILIFRPQQRFLR